MQRTLEDIALSLQKEYKTRVYGNIYDGIYIN